MSNVPLSRYVPPTEILLARLADLLSFAKRKELGPFGEVCIQQLIDGFRQATDASETQDNSLTKGELDALIDHHDWNDAAAEAVEMIEASHYHAKRSQHFVAIREAMVQREEQQTKKVIEGWTK